MPVLYTYRKDGSVFSSTVSVVDGELTLPFSQETDKLELKLEEFKVPVGSEGYFLLPNLNYASTPGALIRFKERPRIIEEHPASFSTPVFGVTTGSKGLLAVVTQEKYSYSLKVEVANGFYELSAVFTPEALPPVIKLFELTGEDANYSGMARCYRNYQLSRGACRTLKERIKEDPALEESTRSTMIRMRMGWKPVPSTVLEQTDENEPPLHVAITFDRAREILKRCREKGLKHAEFCLFNCSTYWDLSVCYKIYSCFSRLTTQVFCLQFVFFTILNKTSSALSKLKGYVFANTLLSYIKYPIIIKRSCKFIRLSAYHNKLNIIKIRFNMYFFK